MRLILTAVPSAPVIRDRFMFGTPEGDPVFGRAGRPRFARAPSVLILSATVWLTAAVTALASPALASPVPSSPGHPSPLAASATAPEVAKFPPDFLWGVSSSGFQSEGSFPDSNWTRYVDKKANGVKDPYNNSVDFRHRYPGDVRLAQGLGVNVFRTSIEWARVEPRRGVRSAAALAYYDDLVRRIRAAGMRPMITLDHWVYPGWVADQGAWDNARTQDDWLRNAQFLVDRYKGQGVLWITFNEISQNLYHELLSRPMNLMQLATMRTALIRTHRAAYDLIHRVDPGAPVSTNVAYGSVFNAVFDAAAFNEVTDKLDFVGIDYYYGANLQNFSAINAMTGEYWKIDPEPEGLYYVLKNYQRRIAEPAPLHRRERDADRRRQAPRRRLHPRRPHARPPLLGAARHRRRREGDRLQPVEPHRQLRVGELPAALRPVHGGRAHRSGAEAASDRRRPGVPVDHREPRSAGRVRAQAQAGLVLDRGPDRDLFRHARHPARPLSKGGALTGYRVDAPTTFYWNDNHFHATLVPRPTRGENGHVLDRR